MDVWIDGWLDGCRGMDGWTDGLMGGRGDRQTDNYGFLCSLLYNLPSMLWI